MADSKRIGVLIVAYNSAGTLAQMLGRIPIEFCSRITKVLVGDDASQDSTHLVALGYKQWATDLPAARASARIDRAAVAVRPQLFAYQFVYELVPDQAG
jgi:hypothetical protein